MCALIAATAAATTAKSSVFAPALEAECSPDFLLSVLCSKDFGKNFLNIKLRKFIAKTRIIRKLKTIAIPITVSDKPSIITVSLLLRFLVLPALRPNIVDYRRNNRSKSRAPDKCFFIKSAQIGPFFHPSGIIEDKFGTIRRQL